MKIHPTHSFTRKLFNWLYCAKCGLINLKNLVTRQAMSQRCPGHEE
jgi:hypothetical protein